MLFSYILCWFWSTALAFLDCIFTNFCHFVSGSGINPKHIKSHYVYWILIITSEWKEWMGRIFSHEKIKGFWIGSIYNYALKAVELSDLWCAQNRCKSIKYQLFKGIQAFDKDVSWMLRCGITGGITSLG